MSHQLDNALVELLAPLTPAEFVNAYWEKQPLYLKGNAGKFAALFDRAALLRAAAVPGIQVRASFDLGVSHLDISPRDIDRAYDSGGTICVTHLETGSPTLRAYLDAIRKQLGLTGKGGVRAYLSPDGKGFDTHFDARVATTLQLEGKKRWWYSARPAIPYPVRQVSPTRDGKATYGAGAMEPRPWEPTTPPTHDQMESVVLEPGDLLCLPSGTWHSARAVGHSLAINLALEPLRFMDLLSSLIGQALVHRDEWRMGLPPSLGDPDRALTEAAAVIHARVQGLGALLKPGPEA